MRCELETPSRDGTTHTSCSATSSPQISARPLLLGTQSGNRLIVVVLPAPFAPSMQNTSPHCRLHREIRSLQRDDVAMALVHVDRVAHSETPLRS